LNILRGEPTSEGTSAYPVCKSIKLRMDISINLLDIKRNRIVIKQEAISIINYQ